MFLYEGLRENDLMHMISDVISIDEYTSKLDEDNITMAFFVNHYEGVNELKDLIEKVHYLEIRDIEIADSITHNNEYILFVELERDNAFPEIVIDIADTVSKVSDNKKWQFKTLGSDKKYELNMENIIEYIRLDKLEEEKIEDNIEESFEPIIISDGAYERKYISHGYIDQKTFDKLLEESETINDRDDYELSLLENKFYDSEVIVTDKNVFIINCDKIMMLS